MTDKEIIKALEYCVGEEYTCENCPFQEIKHYDYENEMFEIMPNGKQYDDWSCERWLNVAVLNLIKRQQAEIERLKNRPYTLQIEVSKKIESQIKAKAIKEFAERLKKHSRKMQSSDFSGDFWDAAVLVEDIDNLVKEMVGDKE